MVQKTLTPVKKKKVTKKKTSKKNAEKKVETIEVTIKKKVTGEAPIEKHFVLHDGKKIKSISGLISEFSKMSEDVFAHHVNDARNDFATWVEDVFGEKDLANELKNARDKVDAEVRAMRKLMIDLVK